MVLVIVGVCLSAILMLTSCFQPLHLAEARSALEAVESIIEDDWKGKPTLSQALYVAIPKYSSSGSREEVTTSQPKTTLITMDQKIRAIFNIPAGNKPVVFPTNISNNQAFNVQRTPDGKLSVVFNDTDITSPLDQPPVNGHRASAAPQGSQDIRDILFPGDKPTIPRTVPKCVQNDQHFCTEVENYPTALLESILLAESKKYEQLFGDDILPTPVFNLTQRIDAPGEETLCFSRERLIHPQSGITKDNNWSVIVNLKNFTQGIRVEECVNPGSSCNMSENFPNGYRTECKQKYIYRQLLSLNAEQQMVKQLFKMPSCCQCVVYNFH